MNKKGFTLVELLTVIAILAILAIIAIPNVLKLFNESKKNIFLSEVRIVYEEAQKKYSTEALKGNKINVISSDGDNKLNISGTIKYYIKLDSNGKISTLNASNNGYYVKFNGDNISKLTLDEIKELKDDDEFELVNKEKNITKCTYNGELVQVAEYMNGQYTYKTYARVDGGSSNPGYFTYKAN